CSWLDRPGGIIWRDTLLCAFRFFALFTLRKISLIRKYVAFGSSLLPAQGIAHRSSILRGSVPDHLAFSPGVSPAQPLERCRLVSHLLHGCASNVSTD